MWLVGNVLYLCLCPFLIPTVLCFHANEGVITFFLVLSVSTVVLFSLLHAHKFLRAIQCAMSCISLVHVEA